MTGKGFAPAPSGGESLVLTPYRWREHVAPSVAIVVKGAWCSVEAQAHRPNCPRRNDGRPESGWWELSYAAVSGGGEFCWDQKCGYTGTFQTVVRPFYICGTSIMAGDYSRMQHRDSWKTSEVPLEPHGNKCNPRLLNRPPPSNMVDSKTGRPARDLPFKQTYGQ